MSTNTELTAFQKAVAAILPDALKTKIKELAVKFNAAPVPPAPPAPPVQLDKQMKTQDGAMTVSIAGDPAPGIAIMDMTSGTPVPLSDGTYTMEDGSTIIVAGGLITTFTPGAPPAPVVDYTTQFAAAKLEFASELKKRDDKITELESTQKDDIEFKKVILEFMDAVLKEPVKEPKKLIPEVDFSKMTPLERYRYHKANEVKATS